MDCVILYGRPELERVAVSFFFLSLFFFISARQPLFCSRTPPVSDVLGLRRQQLHVPIAPGVTPLRYKTAYFGKPSCRSLFRLDMPASRITFKRGRELQASDASRHPPNRKPWDSQEVNFSMFN